MCSGGVSLFSGKKECMHAWHVSFFDRALHILLHSICKSKDSKEVGFFFASPAFAELDPMWRRRRRGVQNLACDNWQRRFVVMRCC
jgi:hypothetical protein